MSDHHYSPGNTIHGPVYLLPRYPVKAPGDEDVTPPYRRYPVWHRNQSVVTHSIREEDQVEVGSLSPWLPQETMNAKDKVIAWLSNEKSIARTLCTGSLAVVVPPTQNNISTPSVPSGRPLAIRKAKSIASLLQKTASKPNVRKPPHFRHITSRSSNSSLDSELTCRGLPNMMIKKEVKMTTKSVVPTDGPADEPPRACDEEIINNFEASTVFTPDENVKVTKFKADANDESLQRYKKSLGLGGGKDLSDPNDSRVCIIQSLTMESPGRDPVTIDLSQPGSENTLKDNPFKIKEGAKFTMVASFRVQHEILSGLQYVQTVKRKGIRVSKDSEMLGSYAPNTDKQPIYTKRFQEEDAPSGMLARGHYNAVSTFVDDDKKQHLQFEWSFDISKDW
ncbi:immunoglobulin E-set [Xylaria curta]|nr:immunoglobulin E-set [Xylaria curta]